MRCSPLTRRRDADALTGALFAIVSYSSAVHATATLTASAISLKVALCLRSALTSAAAWLAMINASGPERRGRVAPQPAVQAGGCILVLLFVSYLADLRSTAGRQRRASDLFPRGF